MRTDVLGYPSVVALMGCNLSDIQALLLAEHFHEVVLLLDGDEAGNIASDKIAVRLSGSFRIYRGRIPPNRQPDELTRNELQAVIEAAVS